MRLALEYIAAFLDCDGSIVIVQSRRKDRRAEYYPKINFYSQNLEVLKDIQETVGGSITPPNRSLMVYTLQMSPRSSVSTAKILAGYLRIKREQALTVVEFDKLNRSERRVGKKSGLGGREPVSDEIYNQRIALCERMRELNHKDSQAFRTNRVKSGETSKGEAILSQAAEGEGSAEGATTRVVSPNNNPPQETPARKGRDSLSSAHSPTVQ